MTHRILLLILLGAVALGIILVVGTPNADAQLTKPQFQTPADRDAVGFGHSDDDDDEGDDGDDGDDECEDLPLVGRTGQVDCWDAAGVPSSCAGTGQDGESQAGVAYPVPRFQDNFDGTITDNSSGLVFLRDAGCFGLQNWAGALSVTAGLSDGSCGLTDGSLAGDWRLPNVRELQSLIDFGTNNPALPLGHPFINLGASGNRYWSSTSSTLNPLNAYAVGINLVGSTRRAPKTAGRNVLPIRD